MRELTIDATLENIGPVTGFVNEAREGVGCPAWIQYQIDVAIDELFGNIARYAYRPGIGPATVTVEVTKAPPAVVVTFVDQGVPYDPLAREDPDVSLPLEEREEGGLGIFLVKKTMDDVSYEYREGRNILRIKKHLP